MSTLQSSPLINKVAESGLITINLEDFLPKLELMVFDIKDYLFRELILREKDFREALSLHDWTQYQDKVLLVYCSADAIIPTWAYMLVAVKAAAYAKDVFQGDEEGYTLNFILDKINSLEPSTFEQARVVVKGCSDRPVPDAAYVAIIKILQPQAQSIMFGEPCSTVPIFKRPRLK